MTSRNEAATRVGSRWGGTLGDPAEQARAARQREMNRQLRSWTPRRLVGWALAAAAALVGAVHWLAHLGWRPIPLSMGWQDLLVGYPTAGLLAIAAAVSLGGKRATGS